MRYLKSLIIAATVMVMAAGSAFAADDALEVHGGGRMGVVVTTLGGSSPGIPGGNNHLGTMPNYGESAYFSLAFSKKTTADGGAWAKVTYQMDYSTGDDTDDVDGDLQKPTWRNRAFNVEFGGLDFMPAGATLWGGLRGYGTGWVGQQDYQFINIAGIGFGVSNIAGMVSIAYMGQDNDYNYSSADVPDLGERTMHNFIISVSTPMIDVFAAVGYAPAGDATDDEAMTNVYGAAIYHAPVLGLNIGVAVATNGYANEMINAPWDTILKTSSYTGVSNTSGPNQGDVDLLGLRVAAWTVTDLAEGLYIAPAIHFDMLQYGSDYGDNTEYAIYASFRLSKALTSNIAFVPTLGYSRAWDAEDTNHGDEADQTIQATLGVEIGLDTGFWSGQKIQFYGTYTMVDDDQALVGDPASPAPENRLGGGYAADDTNSLAFGVLVTFGF